MKPQSLLNIPPVHPDELLLSWVHRMADINAATDFCFISIHFDADFSSDLQIPADLRQGFPHFATAFGLEEFMDEAYLSLSTFPYESIAMTAGQQARYVHNVFRPMDKLNAPVNTVFSALRLCPECMKEDTEKYGGPYFHRAHQLSGVCACHKHGVPLLIFTGEQGHAFDFDEYEQEELSVKPESAAAFARYAKALLDSRTGTDAGVVKRVIFERMAALGYGISDDYDSFLGDFEEWEYSDLWDGGDMVHFFKVKLISANYLFMTEIVPLLMFLFPDVSELAGVFKGHEPLLERHTCPKCSKVYVTTPYAKEAGWGCPSCDAAVPEDVRLRRIINTMTGGDYAPAGDFVSLNEKMDLVHKACGETISVKPRAFLFDGVRCLCESTVTEKEARAAIEANEGFELVTFNGTNEPVKIRHEECGRTFTCRYRKFIQFPGCRACNPPRMTTKAYKERVKALTGGEYTVTGKFVDQHTKIAIRHNKCGCTQLYQPNHFLEGQRCHECGKMPAWDESFDILKQYRDEFGNVNVPKRESYHGYSLGRWCQIQRENKDRLSDEQIKRLNSLGFRWNPLDDEWEENRARYERYTKEKGSPRISRRTDVDGVHLGAWVDTQKKRCREGKLSDERKKKLLLINPELFETKPKDGR